MNKVVIAGVLLAVHIAAFNAHAQSPHYSLGLQAAPMNGLLMTTASATAMLGKRLSVTLSASRATAEGYGSLVSKALLFGIHPKGSGGLDNALFFGIGAATNGVSKGKAQPVVGYSASARVSEALVLGIRAWNEGLAVNHMRMSLEYGIGGHMRVGIGGYRIAGGGNSSDSVTMGMGLVF